MKTVITQEIEIQALVRQGLSTGKKTYATSSFTIESRGGKKLARLFGDVRTSRPHLIYFSTLTWIVLLVALLVSDLAMAQSRNITGTVTDEVTGQSIPGVSVLLAGTTRGTITDIEGNFILEVPDDHSKLSLSFVGYQSVELEVGTKSVINVSMSVNVTELSEIIITGTGVPVEKRKVAFAVETISSDKLPLVPTASIDQALIGKIPGAFIMSGNGSPGSEISIILRGINSINRGTKPMILVNGVEMAVSSLNTLDLGSIDRVEVVQGAASASIYGAQGANGVIQIFTKQGKEGRLQVDFSSSLADNKWLNVGGLAKANLHGFKTDDDNVVVGAGTPGNPLVQDPTTLLYSENVIWDPLDPMLQTNKPYNRNLVYHDHFKEFYTNALTTNNSLAISGASGKVDFNLSASHNHQQSNFKGDGYNDRSNFIFNVGLELAPKLTLRVISQLAHTSNTVSIFNKQDFSANGLIFGILNTRPFADYSLKDTDGDYGIRFGEAAGKVNNLFNPYYTLEYSDTRDNKNDLMENFELDYSPDRFFGINLKYGLNYQNRVVNFSEDNQSQNNNSNAIGLWDGWFSAGRVNTGERSTFEMTNTSQNFLATGNFEVDFAKDLRLNVPLRSSTQIAFDYRSRKTHDYVTYGLGIPLNPPQTANQATTYKIDRDFTTEFITYGYRLNQRFEWGEVAGISGGFRTDYSSAFGSGSKPFTFPRGDAFVRISGFNFWSGSGISRAILEWKIRAAFGKAGIQPQPFDRFPTLSTKTIGGTNSYFVGPAQSNPNLGVEVSTETEIGTDIRFEKLTGNWLRGPALSFTYWKRRTDNSIYRIDAPPSSGLGTIIDNVMSISSNGIQASFNTVVLKDKNFQWSFTANFGKQTTKIESIKNGVQVIANNYVLKAGENIGQLYGLMMLHDVDAVDPKTGEKFIPADVASFYQVAGNGWVVDTRTKQPFVTTNKYSLGTAFPDFNMAFINDFTFKKWMSFGFQIDWIQGGRIYNWTKFNMYREGVHSDYTQEFEINGQTGAWSAFYQGVFLGGIPLEPRNYFYEDGSFVRLRNAYIGIDFASLLNSKIRKLELVISGRNLLTWTKYTGMDPEVNANNTNGVLSQRLDNNVLPNYRTYQATLNIGI